MLSLSQLLLLLSSNAPSYGLCAPVRVASVFLLFSALSKCSSPIVWLRTMYASAPVFLSFVSQLFLARLRFEGGFVCFLRVLRGCGTFDDWDPVVGGVMLNALQISKHFLHSFPATLYLVLLDAEIFSKSNGPKSLCWSVLKLSSSAHCTYFLLSGIL